MPAKQVQGVRQVNGLENFKSEFPVPRQILFYGCFQINGSFLFLTFLNYFLNKGATDTLMLLISIYSNKPEVTDRLFGVKFFYFTLSLHYSFYPTKSDHRNGQFYIPDQSAGGDLLSVW
jgi:hypothetical protein